MSAAVEFGRDYGAKKDAQHTLGETKKKFAETISSEVKCVVFRAGFQQGTEKQCENTEQNTAEKSLEIMGLRIG